jgi:hypothetical protein
MFSYLSLEQRARPDHPLRAIRRLTDDVLAALSPRFTKMFERGDKGFDVPSFVASVRALAVTRARRPENQRQGD